MLALLLLALAAVPPAHTDVVVALGEPGCPRLFGLLSADFQKVAPKETWPAFCESVGRLGDLEPRGTSAGWTVYRARSAKGAFELKLALDSSGKVSGLAVTPWAGAPAYQSTTLKPLLEEIVKARSLPGIAALAIQGGDVVALEVAGVRKAGDPTKVQAADKWHLGSDTKAMTGVLAGMMVDAGQWTWTSTVPELFPRLKSIHPKLKTVTLEMLLEHRSGLVANIPKELWKREPAQVPKAHEDRKYLIDALLELAPNDSGEFVYSNAGYMVVGAALEQRAGKPWERLLQERLFAPLKMASCGFGVQAAAPAVDQPWPHMWRDGKAVAVEATWRADNPPALGPAGTVHCSLGDWAKFVALFVSGDARGLLKKSTLERLQRPNGDYALGWGVRTVDWAKDPILQHSGSNTMNFATAWVSPRLGLGFLAATNLGEEAVARAALADALSFLASGYAKSR